MKTNMPYINEGGIHHIAPDNVNPLLAGFRFMPQAFPFKMFVFRMTRTASLSFSYEVLINTIDSDLIVEYNESDGSWMLKTLKGKPMAGFDKDKMFFDALSYYQFSAAPPFKVIGSSEKADWNSNAIPFYTLDNTGFPSNDFCNNQLAFLILFDLKPEVLNSLTKTV